MRFEPGLLSKAIIAASFAIVFAGCGGGGSDHDDPAPIVDPGPVDPGPVDPQPASLSGTAAGGLPVVGQVTLKDANGTLRTSDIAVDGSYSVDVTELTPPFLLRAVGYVGGRRVTYVSAATELDVDGNVNITPFTDLIVANIAGQVASAYFDSPNFDELTDEQLNAAKTTLTQRLQPLLTNIGLDAGFDLMRTAFNADHTGFDAVMDLVKVTVDADTGIALIRDLVNGTSISDNLADKTDATIIDAPQVPLLTGLTDIAAIQSQLKAFTDLFATSIPDPDNATLRALFVAEGFLDYGYDLETFLHDVTTDDEIIGIQFSDVKIAQRVDEDTIRVEITDYSGEGDYNETFEWTMEKVDGVWKIAGNLLPVDISPDAINARNLSGTFGSLPNGVADQYRRYLELWVDYAPPGIDYVHVTGPGITGEVVLKRSVQWQGFVITQIDGETEANSGSWLAECSELPPANTPCIDFSSVGLNAQYTFSARDENDAAIDGVSDFTLTLVAPPVSNATAQANAAKWFASIASVTPASYSELTDGTNINVGLTMPTDSRYFFDYLNYVAPEITVHDDGLAANGTSVDLTWSGEAPVITDQWTIPQINVATIGENNRQFVTLGRHNQP